MEPVIEKYLETKNEATRKRYKRAFITLKEFMKDESIESLIKKEREDRKKLPENRERPIVFLLNNFIKYLSKKYAPKTINLYIVAIRDFFSENELIIRSKHLNLPRDEPLQENKKLIIRRKEVKLLVDHCRNNRDKAIILSLYQSGLTIGDLLNLNCGQVKDPSPYFGSLEDPPLLIENIRRKNGIKHFTCFGRSACTALKRYLTERERVYHTVSYDQPLFTQIRGDKTKIKRMTVADVDYVFQKLVLRTGIISKEKLERSTVSPCRPHALRKGFKGTLTDHNCPLDFVEYCMGHKNQYSNAYFDDDGLKTRETYKKFEEFLNIEEYEETGVMDEISLLKKEHRLLVRVIKSLAKDWGYDLEDPEAELFTKFYGEDEKITNEEIESFMDMFATGPPLDHPQKLKPPLPIRIGEDLKSSKKKKT